MLNSEYVPAALPLQSKSSRVRQRGWSARLSLPMVHSFPEGWDQLSEVNSIHKDKAARTQGNWTSKTQLSCTPRPHCLTALITGVTVGRHSLHIWVLSRCQKEHCWNV